MKISPLNQGLDSVQLAQDSLSVDEYPVSRSLPPDGRAVTDHVSLLYPVSPSEHLLDNFAKPVNGDERVNDPEVSNQVFEGLIEKLSRGKAETATHTACKLLNQQHQDFSSLLESLKHLVHA